MNGIVDDVSHVSRGAGVVRYGNTHLGIELEGTEITSDLDISAVVRTLGDINVEMPRLENFEAFAEEKVTKRNVILVQIARDLLEYIFRCNCGAIGLLVQNKSNEDSAGLGHNGLVRCGGLVNDSLEFERLNDHMFSVTVR